jgi:hypothetical protein
MTLFEESEGKQIFMVKEVAKILYGKDYTETDVQRIYRGIREGEIKTVKFAGRHHLQKWQLKELVCAHD